MAILQCGLEVWGMFEILFVKFLMAGLAGIGSDVLACSGVVWCSLLLLFPGGSRTDDQKQRRSQ